MATNVEARAVDYVTLFRSNAVPTVCFLIDDPDNFNLGKFHKVQAHAVLKDNSTYNKCCIRHPIEIAKVLKDEAKNKNLLRTNTGEDRDRNPKVERAQALMFCLFMKLNLDKLT